MKTIWIAVLIFMVGLTTNAQNLKPFKDFNNLSLYGFKDDKGNIIVTGKYYHANEFSEGLAAVSRAYNDEWGNEYYNWGFIDQTGKEVIPVKYKFVSDFSEGLAVVSLNGKFGFIDKTGKMTIQEKYDGAISFIDGLALVSVNDKYGFINQRGEEIIPLKYDGISEFSEGLSAVKIIDKTSMPYIIKWGYINKTGETVVPLKEYDYILNFDKGKAEVKLNGRVFYIDKAGKEIK